MRTTTLGVLVAGALVAVPAFAGPPDTSRIATSAKWVMHMDVQAVTASALATGVKDLIPAGGPALAAKWEGLKAVRSVTLFGPTADKAQAVAVADLDYNKPDVMKILGIAAGADTEAHGNHAIYTFTAKGHRAIAGTKQHVCFYDGSTIVAGGQLESVKATLDLLDGKAEGLGATTALGQMLVPVEGSLLLVAVQDVGELTAGRGSSALHNVMDVRIECGEASEDAFFTCGMTLWTEDDAALIEQMAQGALAMMKLRFQDNEKITRFLGSVEVVRDGTSVSTSFTYPVDAMLSTLRDCINAKATTH